MSRFVPLYRELAAAGGNFRGLTILQHAKQINELVRKHRATRLLDYGCGAGDAYKSPHKLHKVFGMRWFDIDLYDPAFPEHAELPYAMVDGVLCSDVLEHIPEDELDETVARLVKHARRFVWASVCCRPAAKSFADGTNMHVTLQPLEWWETLFERFRPTDRELEIVLVETP